MSVAWDDMSKAEQALVNRYEKMAEPEFLQKQAEKMAKRRQMENFVATHSLSCFECGAQFNRWASTGTNQWGKPWAICQPCIWKRNEVS